MVGNLGSLGSGFCRLSYGIIFDKYGFKTAFNILVICDLVLIATINIINVDKTLFSIWIMILLGGQGGKSSVMVAFTVQTFGVTCGGSIYAKLLIA